MRARRYAAQLQRDYELRKGELEVTGQQLTAVKLGSVEEVLM